MNIRADNSWFKIPLVSFLVHVILLFTILYGISQYYNFWEVQILLSKNRAELTSIQENINNLQSSNNYLNSPVYTEKLRKDLNYQKEGETVIDVSGLENVEQQATIFTPEVVTSNLTNLEKWWLCFFNPKQIRCFP